MEQALRPRISVVHDAADLPHAIEALIALDGFRGAVAAGRLAAEWCDGGPYAALHEERFEAAPLPADAKDIWQALGAVAEAEADAALRSFLALRDGVVAARAARQPRPWPPPTREQALKRLRETAKPLLGNLSRALTATDLRELARRLPLVRSVAKREQLLSVFSKHDFPDDPGVLLSLEPRTRGRARWFMWRALERLSDPRIRARAEERLIRTTTPGTYLRALLRHRRPGDDAYLSGLVARTHAAPNVEAVAGAAVDHYAAHPTLACRPPLLALYERMACGICRLKVVRLLHANGGLPAAVAAALPHDSYAETRAFAKF